MNAIGIQYKTFNSFQDAQLYANTEIDLNLDLKFDQNANHSQIYNNNTTFPTTNNNLLENQNIFQLSQNNINNNNQNIKTFRIFTCGSARKVSKSPNQNIKICCYSIYITPLNIKITGKLGTSSNDNNDNNIAEKIDPSEYLSTKRADIYSIYQALIEIDRDITKSIKNNLGIKNFMIITNDQISCKLISNSYQKWTQLMNKVQYWGVIDQKLVISKFSESINKNSRKYLYLLINSVKLIQKINQTYYKSGIPSLQIRGFNKTNESESQANKIACESVREACKHYSSQLQQNQLV
ncbi:uncharacterized protein ASCRUDRAFT_68413 [Ascoidea rubescens DSM 1968]|uniref:Uncharacterized protein n=1 Tax=Ascoidea rubescens DSM 1968 TaxID=1344418 RepID=A0A1D2VS71_9ASCO|nr:hypothetical protein ASCRUDRAFT_68413 [Ascoidea rubescens DSM 1968]ODV64438.1 hypothetical protein ASCRUDRAFT_68413 [Ascoidea rubescens DSM 1968]